MLRMKSTELARGGGGSSISVGGRGREGRGGWGTKRGWGNKGESKEGLECGGPLVSGWDLNRRRYGGISFRNRASSQPALTFSYSIRPSNNRIVLYSLPLMQYISDVTFLSIMQLNATITACKCISGFTASGFCIHRTRCTFKNVA